MTQSIPTPPADNAGAYVVLSYSDGSHTHRSRLHLAAMVPTADSAGAAGQTFQYASVTGASAPTTTPNADLTAYMNAWALFYNNQWTIQVTGLWLKIVGLWEEQFSYVAPPGVSGTAAVATSALQQSGETIYNIRSKNGGRARAILIGNSDWSANNSFQVAATFATTPNRYVQIMNVLANPSSGFRAHDGGELASVAHVTMPYNRRLRRHYGQA